MRRLFTFCFVLIGFLFADTALADALVIVVLRDSAGKTAEGKVILSADDKGVKYSCQTQKGKCSMAAVPGGSYKVTVEPTKGSAPPARKVMIPPSGKVELYVASEGTKTDPKSLSPHSK
jgi:hypothetical protein